MRQRGSRLLLPVLLLFTALATWCGASGAGQEPGAASVSPVAGPLLPYQLLLAAADGVESNATAAPFDVGRPLSVDSSAVLTMSSTTGALTLLSAIVSPALCAQTARIYLVLQLSQCNFHDLQDIEVIFYPLQFTVGGDPTAKYFTALVFVWPFGLALVGIHYVVCRIAGRGGDPERLESWLRALHFPSLSLTATILFFWQPMTMSAVTVLSRGQNDWYRFLCFIGLLVSFILFAFAVRWHHVRLQDVEYLDTVAYASRAREEWASPEELDPALLAADPIVCTMATVATAHHTLAERLLTAPGVWVDRKRVDNPDEPYRDRGFVDKFGHMIIKYKPGRHWFLGVEVAASTVMGCLQGVRPTTEFGCWVLSVAQLAALGLLTLLLLGLRPYATAFDNFGFALLALSQLAASVLLMVDFDELLRKAASVFSDSPASSGGSNSTATIALVGNSSGTAAPPPSEVRVASDSIAFGCLCVVAAKAVADVLIVVVYRFRRGRAAAAGAHDASTAATPKASKDKEVVARTPRSAGTVEKETPLLGVGKGAGKTGPRSGAQATNDNDDDEEEDDVEALLAVIPTKRQNPRADQSSSPSPLPALARAKKGRDQERGRPKGLAAGRNGSESDGGEEMRPRDVLRSSKSSGRRDDSKESSAKSAEKKRERDRDRERRGEKSSESPSAGRAAKGKSRGRPELEL